MSPKKISINIVTYNALKYLPHCLDSIKKQSFSNYEVLILDNNSSDGSIKYIKDNYPEFKIIENKKNLGFAKAHNLGIKKSSGDYVLCLNQDIILDNDFLTNVDQFLDSHLRVASLSGKLYYWDFQNNKKTQQIDSLGIKVHKNFKFSDLNQGEFDSDDFCQEIEIFGPSGAAPVYRRSALEEIALDGEYFDEDFFMYKEDIDLAFRLHLAGWFSYFLPQAQAYHDRTLKSDQHLIKNRRQRSQISNYYSYRNHLFVLLKNLDVKIFLKYFFYISFFEFVKLGYILIFEPKNVIAALDFLGKSAKVFSKRKLIQNSKKVGSSFTEHWIAK